MKGKTGTAKTTCDNESKAIKDKSNKKIREFDSCPERVAREDLAQSSVETVEEKSCRESRKDLSKAETAISKKCGAKCLDKAVQCVRCSQGDTNCDEDDDDDEEDSEKINILKIWQNRKDSPSKKEALKNIRNLEREFKSCPLVASDDLKSLKEDIKDIKKEKKDLEKDISDKQKEIDELKEKDAKATLEFEASKSKLEQEMEDLTGELEKNLEEVTTEGERKVLEIEKRLVEIDGEIEGLNLDEVKTQHALNEVRLKAQGECHESALRQVGELRKRKAKLVQESLDIKGGFKSLLRGAGLSKKAAAKKLVQELRRDCMNDKIYKDKMKVLYTKTEQTKKLIKASIQSKKKEKEQLRSSAKKILSEVSRSAEKALKEAAKLIKRKEKEIVQVQKNRAIDQQAFQSNLDRLQREIHNLRLQLQENEEFLANKQRILGLKQKYKVPGLKGDSTDAIGLTEDARNKARDVMSNCSCPSSIDSSLNASQIRAIMKKCESAYRFLNRVSPEAEYPTRNDDSPSTTDSSGAR